MLKSLTYFVIGIAFSIQVHANKGLEIAKKVDAANNGFKTDSSQLEMILTNAHGDQVKRNLETRTIEVPSDGDKSLTKFTSPRDVKGTKLLTWSHKKKDNDQWLFMPAIKRTKRLNGRSKTGAFMGSEFSFEDIGSQELEKFTYKFIEEKPESGRKTWVVERMPTEKSSGYKKQKVWFDQEYLNPIKIEYYDRKGTLLKIAKFKGYKKHGNFWRHTEIEMKNVQTKKSSNLIWKNRNIGKKIPKRIFKSSNLSS